MPSMRSARISLLVCVIFLVGAVCSTPLTPTPTEKHMGLTPVLEKRTDPTFPPQPPSCPRCAQDYPSITHCAQAAPAFANFSQIIFAPGEFLDLIQCACTETFQSVFPQCVDCFQQTNQTDVLQTDGDSDELPSIVSGMRSVCALASTLLGNVTGANGEQINGTPSPIPMSGGATGISPLSSSVLILNLGMAAVLAFAGSTLL